MMADIKDIKQNSQEIWKDLNGLDPNYTVRVSNTGKVSLKIHGTRDSKGRLYVNIGGSDIPVDYLIAKAFIANPQSGNDIRHKDNNMGNNTVSNLEWFFNPEIDSLFTPTALVNKIQPHQNPMVSTMSVMTKSSAVQSQQSSSQNSPVQPRIDYSAPTVYNYVTKDNTPKLEDVPNSQFNQMKTRQEQAQIDKQIQELHDEYQKKINSLRETGSLTPQSSQPSYADSISYAQQQSYGSAEIFRPRKQSHIVNIPDRLKDDDDAQYNNYGGSSVSQNNMASQPQASQQSNNSGLRSPFVNYDSDVQQPAMNLQPFTNVQPSVNPQNVQENSSSIKGVEYNRLEQLNPNAQNAIIQTLVQNQVGGNSQYNSQYKVPKQETVELDMSKGSPLINPRDNGIVYQRVEKPATSYEDWKGGTDLNTLQVKAQKIVEIPMEKLMEEGVRGGNYNKKKVCCTLRNGAEKIFDSVTEAAEFCGVDHSAISKCCRGNIGLVKGMHFRYVELKDIESVLDMYINDIAEAAGNKPEVDLTPRRRGRPAGTTKEAMAVRRALEAAQKKKSKRKNKRT